MAKLLFALFCAIAIASVCQGTRYDGYHVYRVTFQTEEQFNFLFKMDMKSTKDIMFWQLSHAGRYADVMVSPAKTSDFLALMDVNGITYKLLIEDVQKTIEKGY